jgi:hypothetical protein
MLAVSDKERGSLSISKRTKQITDVKIKVWKRSTLKEF